MIVLSDSPRKIIGKWETCPNLWHAFSWSIPDKNSHIIRCIKSDSFQGYVGVHKSWEDNIYKEEQWAKISVDRKRSRRIVLKNHRTTAAQVTAELNIHLEDRFHENCPT
jgi:hypothetical protein